MKEERTYRKLHKGKDLVYFHVEIEQTDLEIGANRVLRKQAMQSVARYRKDIEGYIKREPGFLTSLVPVICPMDAPKIVKAMCRAAEKAGVGPMAAVAGAMSEFVGKDLLEFSREIIVENGGDIYIKSDRERIIGVYAGESPLTNKIGLRICPEDTPLGVCTSSGRIGHSLSLGNADAVVILSKDTALADAVATATGNIVKVPGDIEKALEFTKNIEGILGAVIVVKEKIGAWGSVQLTRL